jgi:hypothetical protein
MQVNTRDSLKRQTRRKWLLCSIAVTAAGCKRAPRPEAKQLAVGWRPLGSWSGRGDAQTDSFNSDSGQWRIKWETRNAEQPGPAAFRVTVHSAVSGRPLSVAVDHNGAGHGIAYVNEDPRLFHLVIESRGLDWTVSVEEAVVGAIRTDP